jgi:dihydrodipicolinate synthase/N-acetylneuraminate lyase
MDQVNGRIPVLAGVSGTNPHEVISSMEYYGKLQCDAVSLSPPYYFKLGTQTVRGFLDMAIDKCPIPVFLYNIPQFANEIPRDTILDLCEIRKVIGIKDSSRKFPEFCSLMWALKKKRPDFLLFNGTEEILAPSLLMGADGGIVATSGIVPEVTTALYAAFVAGDVGSMKVLQMALAPLIEAMLSIDFPLGFRVAMALRGFEPGPGRLSFATHTTAVRELSGRLEPMLNDILRKVQS